MSYRKFMHIFKKITYRYSVSVVFCGVLKVMNIVDLGFHMFVHVTLTNGLTGDNICEYNDTHLR